MSDWPRLDPITGRKICSNCWNGIHYHELHFRKVDGKMQNYYVQTTALTGKAEHACTGECDCIHLSEENWAAIEKKKQTEAKREKKKIGKALLEDESNPLRAVNPNYQKGRLA